MRTILAFRLYAHDDEIKELGWHFSPVTAEYARLWYDQHEKMPYKEWEAEVREVEFTIDVEREIIFLYVYNTEYVSRAKLVGYVGEEKVKELEDVKFDPKHTRPLDCCGYDTVWDCETKGNNVYGVGFLNIPMKEP